MPKKKSVNLAPGGEDAAARSPGSNSGDEKPAAEQLKSKKTTKKRARTAWSIAPTRQRYDYVNDFDSLAKSRTAKVCAYRWESILIARDNRKSATMLQSEHTDNEQGNFSNRKDGLESIFDCSDLIIPSTTDLLEREVEKAIEKWKALDSRVIHETDFYSSGNNDNDVGGGKSEVAINIGPVAVKNGDRISVGGRPIKETLLPPNFDYQCRKKAPINNKDEEFDEDNNNNNNVLGNHDWSKKGRKRVISLSDPSQTLDYESELWKVFKSMPTVQEVEQRYALGGGGGGGDVEVKATKTTNDGTGSNDISFPPGCQHTLTVRNTLEKLRRKYTRIDAHSLGRLRVRDRHSSLYDYNNSGVGNDTTMMSQTSFALQTTLRFEVLKPNVEDLRRGSGPDGSRLELELHGSHHTLLDLHHTLVEHASISSNSVGIGDHIPAGVFLIENVLYTRGEVGEAAANSILSWLDEHKSKLTIEEKKKEVAPSTATAADTSTGINSSRKKLKMVSMSGIKLEDLPLRLGVRYAHINLQSSEMNDMNDKSWDEDNVSALFVTDIKSRIVRRSPLSENGESVEANQVNARVPIVIHDIWTSSQQSQIHNMCAACNYLPATVATMNDVMTDSSLNIPDNSIETARQGTPLCASCFRELHYQRSVESGEMLQLRPNRSQLKVFPVNSTR